MSVRHVITLQPPLVGVHLYVCCSCSEEPIARVGFPTAPASLVEVNEIAHAHIEAADREDNYRELSARAVVNWRGTERIVHQLRPAPYTGDPTY